MTEIMVPPPAATYLCSMRFKVLLFGFIIVVAASSVFAHCDSVKGPVITTAQAALDKGDVTPVLKWVPASKEAEVRDAFAKTLAARKASPAAREVADRWFFETLVRVHRESEGAPYTGLKGADYKPEAGIELADKAVESGSLDEVQKAVLTGLRQRFAHVQETKKHANDSVEAGREYVHAYVEFIHYVERLQGPGGHEQVAEGH